MIDVIQSLETGEGNEGKEDRQEPTGQKAEEQFPGYGHAKKLDPVALHGSRLYQSHGQVGWMPRLPARRQGRGGKPTL